MGQPCTYVEKECSWQREQYIHRDELGIVCEQRDGLGDGGRVRRGRRERTREQSSAWVRGGRHCSAWEDVWLLQAGAQLEAIMGRQCSWVLGPIRWPLLYIHYSSSLGSGTGDCWKQVMSGGLVSSSRMTAVGGRNPTTPPRLITATYLT